MCKDVPPVITDVSRAIQRLNAAPGDRTLLDLVAANLAFQFNRQWTPFVPEPGDLSGITTRDIQIALSVHGASGSVIGIHAHEIGVRVRAYVEFHLQCQWSRTPEGSKFVVVERPCKERQTHAVSDGVTSIKLCAAHADLAVKHPTGVYLTVEPILGE
jgi:hypothetical protein